MKLLKHLSVAQEKQQLSFELKNFSAVTKTTTHNTNSFARVSPKFFGGIADVLESRFPFFCYLRLISVGAAFGSIVSCFTGAAVVAGIVGTSVGSISQYYT